MTDYIKKVMPTTVNESQKHSLSKFYLCSICHVGYMEMSHQKFEIRLIHLYNYVLTGTL